MKGHGSRAAVATICRAGAFFRSLFSRAVHIGLGFGIPRASSRSLPQSPPYPIAGRNVVYRPSYRFSQYGIFLDEFQEMIGIDALDDYLRSFRKFGCSVYLATQHLEFTSALRTPRTPRFGIAFG